MYIFPILWFVVTQHNVHIFVCMYLFERQQVAHPVKGEVIR